ncbi:Plant UBX domain-containing protein 9 [Linum grandiflorum]
MARPSRDAIDTFVRVTGTSHSLAARIIEEHGGNLDEALNSHFSGIESSSSNAVPSTFPQHNPADARNQVRNEPQGILPVLSAARSFRPSLLLDPNYRRNLWSQLGASVFNSGRPPHSQNTPYNAFDQPYHQPGVRPVTQDVYQASLTSDVHPYGNMPRYDVPHPSDNNVEEEMVKRAIEASKQEIQTPSRAGVAQSELHLEDEELARAVSLSMKTAEEENVIREHLEKDQLPRVGDPSIRTGSSGLDRWQAESSNSGGKVDDEQLWSAMSSEELDEAILLETAIFGQSHGESSIQRASAVPNYKDNSTVVNTDTAPNPLALVQKERQSLRQQQDNEYLASLLADKEKEVAALKKPELSSPNEQSCQEKVLDDVLSLCQDTERLLAAKEALLPQEPPADEENAVNILIRMPDGSRRGRRFLKSDKLKYVFDFIDIGRAVKPGTYRVVKPYPRSAFSVQDSGSSLSEVGLNSKQEALFMEFIYICCT